MGTHLVVVPPPLLDADPRFDTVSEPLQSKVPDAQWPELAGRARACYQAASPALALLLAKRELANGSS